MSSGDSKHHVLLTAPQHSVCATRRHAGTRITLVKHTHTHTHTHTRMDTRTHIDPHNHKHIHTHTHTHTHRHKLTYAGETKYNKLAIVYSTNTVSPCTGYLF